MRHTLLQSTQDYSSLIGVPYEVSDCWGIVKDFYSLVFNKELPDYYDEAPNDDNLANMYVENAKGNFERVETPEFGDLILIRLNGIPCHIGVFIGEGKMLHTIRGSGCVIERLSRWIPRIEGIYRVVE